MLKIIVSVGWIVRLIRMTVLVMKMLQIAIVNIAANAEAPFDGVFPGTVSDAASSAGAGNLQVLAVGSHLSTKAAHICIAAWPRLSQAAVTVNLHGVSLIVIIRDSTKARFRL